MTISLENIGKRYNFEWIFRGLDFTFNADNKYAILGPNGSGKSTLLQIIAGSLHHTEGEIRYTGAGKKYDPGAVFSRIGLAAPYLELVEEFTLAELLRFQEKFKPFITGLSTREMAALVNLEPVLHKQIRYYSSGMKQRAKLAAAIFSDTPLLLLDEPCTNLDEAGVTIYHELMERFTPGRTVLVSSNEPKEYDICPHRLVLTDFKA